MYKNKVEFRYIYFGKLKCTPLSRQLFNKNKIVFIKVYFELFFDYKEQENGMQRSGMEFSCSSAVRPPVFALSWHHILLFNAYYHPSFPCLYITENATLPAFDIQAIDAISRCYKTQNTFLNLIPPLSPFYSPLGTPPRTLPTSTTVL